MYCELCGSLVNGIICGKCGRVQTDQLTYQKETIEFFKGIVNYFNQHKKIYDKFSYLVFYGNAGDNGCCLWIEKTVMNTERFA